jgi:hypothetical protein
LLTIDINEMLVDHWYQLNVCWQLISMKCLLIIDINEMFVDNWYQWNICWQLISIKCLLTIDINEMFVDDWYHWNVCWQLISLKCLLTIDINQISVDNWYQWSVCWQLISMKCLLTIDINQISVDNVDLILINSTPIFDLHGALNFIILWCPQSSWIQWVIVWYNYMNPVKMSICFLIHWSPKKKKIVSILDFISCFHS